MTSSQSLSDERGTFSRRSVFILAAIGSAVGLGNIWRFPYVAFDNGGGAFLVPYVVALLMAGVPLLLLDYALGHRYRTSAPLTFRRFRRWTEPIGWFQVGICFVISTYYAVIIAWAVRYTFFSINRVWGDDTETFFASTFLQASSATEGLTTTFVWGVTLPLIAIWVFTLAVLAAGVQKGVGGTASVFVPLLIGLFIILVIRALTLPGAMEGLDALFSPDWSALKNTGVWVSAFGQVFFSLSVAFGIMLTYASYLKRKTNLTGSGIVVAFSNSSFEVLAGIGVFATLGFLAHNQGIAVQETVDDGIGLAFMAFPTIISQMPGGALFGVLFFGSLVLAGLTSLISLVEVVVAAVYDKLGLSRPATAALVCVPMGLASVLLFSTTSGINVLDVVDKFINNVGVIASAIAGVVAVAWIGRSLPQAAQHLNAVSSLRVGKIWMVVTGVITPIVLIYMLVTELQSLLSKGYGDYPSSLINTAGWGVLGILLVLSLLLSLTSWRARSPEFGGSDLYNPAVIDGTIKED